MTAQAMRPATVLTLVAGRGTFRLGVQVMSVALVVVWGGDAFGHYTNALGLCTWLLFLATAPEKTALKVLPRTRLLSARLARLVLVLAGAPVAVLLVTLLVVLAIAPGSTVVLYLAAGTWSTGTGLLMTVSGLHRLRGRPALDAAGFVLAAVVVVAGTTATWLIRWSPVAHLLVLVGGMLTVVAGSLFALPAQWRRPGPRGGRRLFSGVGRSTALLGVADVLDALAGSSIYLVLALAGRAAASGPFYLTMLVSAMICQFLAYQLKIAQPRVSARLRGTGGQAGRRRAIWLLRIAERFGVGFAVCFAVCVALPSSRDFLLHDNGLRLVLVLIPVTAVEIVISMVVYYAGFLLENTNSKVLTVTSGAALAGLAGTALLAVAIAPPFGALGGLAAAMLGFAVKAFAMRKLLYRRHPELTRTPSTVDQIIAAAGR